MAPSASEMTDTTLQDRAESAELAIDILARAYAALAGTFESAHPEEFTALRPTMRVFLAESLRGAEARIEDGRLTLAAFQGAITHIRRAMQSADEAVADPAV